MKKLTVLGFIACVGLLFAPVGVIAEKPKPIEVTAPVPLPVTTEPGDSVTVTGEVEVTDMPEVTVGNDSLNPIPVTVQPDGFPVHISSVYRFAGFTAATTDGDTGGLPGMHRLCQAEYGIDARMCTTEEWKLSPEITSITYEGERIEAWISPVWTHIETFIDEWTEPTTPKIKFFVIDISGRSWLYEYDVSAVTPSHTPNLLSNCWQWKDDRSSSFGTEVDVERNEIEIHITSPCSSMNRVTCCTPVSSADHP